MDPRTGELYSIEQIKAATTAGGITEADLVYLEGKPEDIHRISEVLKSDWSKQQKKERNKKNKAAKASRKKNR